MAQVSLMSKAKARLCLYHPFFAALVFGTEIVVDNRCTTAYTDMKKIGYNEKFIDSLDIDVVQFVLGHEALHMLLKHGLRMGNRKVIVLAPHPEGEVDYRMPDGTIQKMTRVSLWNIACDYAINWMLKQDNFKLWDKACYDVKYANMSAEDIYDDLLDKMPPPPPGGGVVGGGGNGGVSGISTESGAMGDDVRSPEEGLSEVEKREIERDINGWVARAAQQTKMMGKMPAHMERVIHDMFNPPQSWEELFREFFTQTTAASDETWNHRNRRFNDIYLPKRQVLNTLGEVVLIGDTSGSIRDDVFAQVASEIEGMREQVRPERVRVIWADDEDCSREEVFEEHDPIDLHPKGGGGTDMRKPLKHVEQFDPIVVVLVTDGYTPWLEQAPPYPLIILCTTDAKCPDYATTIKLPIGKEKTTRASHMVTVKAA